HQLRHALEKTSALRRVGKQARLVVELVVLGKLEASEVRHARMRSVEQIQEPEAFGGVADVAQRPHLQLSGPTHLEQVGKLLLDELDSNTHRIHALFPKLVELTVGGRRRRSDGQRERLAVRQIPPTVTVAVDITEFVEQSSGACGVEANVAVELRVVAGDIRRNRL